MKTDAELKKYNITRRSAKTCECSKDSFIYRIPIKLEEGIIEFLKCLGNPAFDMKKTSVLKIENPILAITGIRRLKEIRLAIKKSENKGIIDVFEDALIKYVDGDKK